MCYHSSPHVPTLPVPLNEMYLRFLSSDEREAHLTTQTRVTHVVSVFLTFPYFSCHVKKIRPDWTCLLDYQMSCRLLCGFAVEISVLSPPSITLCSVEEADPAVVSYWYLCSSSALNRKGLRPQLLTSYSEKKKYIHIWSKLRLSFRK